MFLTYSAAKQNFCRKQGGTSMISIVKGKTEISLSHQERSSFTTEPFVRANSEGSGSERGNGLRMGPSKMLVGRPFPLSLERLPCPDSGPTCGFSFQPAIVRPFFFSSWVSIDHATRHPFAAFRSRYGSDRAIHKTTSAED
jgi:hypothetical protein